MPQTKQAAAPAQPIQPEAPKPTAAALRKAETKHQFEMLQEFIRALDGMCITDFEALRTFMLILSRDRGCSTPIEDFLVSVVHIYQSRDDDTEGLTVKDIQWQLEQSLTDDAAMERRLKRPTFWRNAIHCRRPAK